MVVSYQSGNSVYLQQFSNDGTINGEPVLVNPDFAGEQLNTEIIPLANGTYYVSWTEIQDDSTPYVYARHFSAEGVASGMPFLVSDNADNNATDAHLISFRRW